MAHKLKLHTSCGAPGLAMCAKTAAQPGEGEGGSLPAKDELGPRQEGPYKLLLWLLSSALNPSHSRRQEQELPFWAGREVGTAESHLGK